MAWVPGLRGNGEHEHGWQRQLRSIRKHFSAPASEQILVFKMIAAFLHACFDPEAWSAVRRLDRDT